MKRCATHHIEITTVQYCGQCHSNGDEFLLPPLPTAGSGSGVRGAAAGIPNSNNASPDFEPSEWEQADHSVASEGELTEGRSIYSAVE